MVYWAKLPECKMNNKYYSLGIDTSNYTTSIAVADNEFRIIADERMPLEVSQGERGLRQSNAFFKHIYNLPVLLEKTFQCIDSSLVRCVAVSSRPRPLEGSYMPVFMSGQAISKSIASALGTSYFEFSHQEGHIRAGNISNNLSNFICLHISGGTTEILEVNAIQSGYNIGLLGGTKDISIGQLIDRIGVELGFSFPCGSALDDLAAGFKGEETHILKDIFIDGLKMNLSGIETQCLKQIEKGIESQIIIHELFEKISKALISVIDNVVQAAEINNVLLVGGVSASRYIRNYITLKLRNKGICVYFGEPRYASDNAVGIAMMGMDELRKFHL